MKNTIDAQIEFSFQGKTYSLSSTIDLDQFLEHEHSFPSFHAILAKEHRIDTYSYLYEVMQETEIEFKNAQGMAAKFLHGGIFDLNGFKGSWQEHKTLALLRPVAMRELGISDLEQHQPIKNALVQAFNLGRNA